MLPQNKKKRARIIDTKSQASVFLETVNVGARDTVTVLHNHPQMLPLAI
jgi:hypothetical protein